MNKLYLITRGSEIVDYDEYDSIIVCESCEDEAKKWIPTGYKLKNLEDIVNRDKIVPIVITEEEDKDTKIDMRYEGWIRDLNQLKSIELGIAHPSTEIGVVLTSFQAG